MKDNLIEEAILLRSQGLREKAIRSLEDYCLKNPGDLDMAVTLKVWKKEISQEGWAMARRNAARSSCDERFGEWSRLLELWGYEFPIPFPQETLPDIPSPIVANDMVIVPDPSLQSFLGLRVSDGHSLPSRKVLGGKLSYASTPVYLPPFLLFASNGSLWQISFSKDEISSSPIMKDSRIQILRYCTPMSIGEVAIFGLREWILLYRPQTNEARFIPYKLSRKDDVISTPLQWNGEAVFVSRYGEILRVSFREDELEGAELSIRKIEEVTDAVCSPPCLCGNSLYFESLNPDGLRSICEYSLSGDGELKMEGIEEGVCSPEDTHLHFPPIVFQDGVIVSSDIEPRLYYAQGGYPMRVLPINIEIHKGSLRIHQISHIFAFILGSRLVGKTPKGFFYLNLLDPGEGGIEIFRPPTEMIAQPINYGHRLFFMTMMGVKCYLVK